MEKKIDVLYAEDDDKMAKMVKNLLEDHEFHVRIACDGKRVWDVFQHSPPVGFGNAEKRWVEDC